MKIKGIIFKKVLIEKRIMNWVWVFYVGGIVDEKFGKWLMMIGRDKDIDGI